MAGVITLSPGNIRIILMTRAGFSWWGAWGPAIGVGDGGKGVALPHYTPLPPKKSRKIFFSGKHNVKFGHFVNFFIHNFGQKCLAAAKFD